LITVSPVSGLVKTTLPAAVLLKSALCGASHSLTRTLKAMLIVWPVPQKSGSTSVPTSRKWLPWPAAKVVGAG
jgi:hypothetical protein